MAMNTSEDTFHSFHDSFPVSPKRRSSPDHGFVFVGNDNDSADAPSQQVVPRPAGPNFQDETDSEFCIHLS